MAIRPVRPSARTRASGCPRRHRGGAGLRRPRGCRRGRDRARLAPVRRRQHDDRPDAGVHAAHDDASATTDDLANGVVEGSSLPDLMQMLTQAVTRAAIDAQAGRLVMLHAAGIQDPTTGAVVALVGPGGTGKTTLIRTLVPRPRLHHGRDCRHHRRQHRAALPQAAVGPPRAASSPWKDETDPLHFGALAPSQPATLAGIVMLDRRDGYAGSAGCGGRAHPRCHRRTDPGDVPPPGDGEAAAADGRPLRLAWAASCA